MSSRSGVATLRTAIHLLLTYLQTEAVGNESVPIQLAQCSFSGLAVSSAKIWHSPKVVLLYIISRVSYFVMLYMLTIYTYSQLVNLLLSVYFAT